MAIVLKKKNGLPDLSAGASIAAGEEQQAQHVVEPVQATTNENDQSGEMSTSTESSADDDHVVIDFPAVDGGAISRELTEDAIAEEFAQRYEKELRFDHKLGRWFRWIGSRWAPDHTHAAFDFARRL